LRGSIKAVHLLPYHTLGRAKYSALGRDYPWADQQQLTEAHLRAAADLFAGRQVPVDIGG
jgi:pyruvate-formate lyase-activating enzyme